MVDKIIKKFSLKYDNFFYKKWVDDKNFLGGWSIPKKTLTENIIKIIENGYQNQIYYVGDYLREIENIGSVTNAMNSVDNLLNILKK